MTLKDPNQLFYGGIMRKFYKSKKSNYDLSDLEIVIDDDDDEYESVSTVPDKKVLKEKKESEGQNIIDKAPLKEDKKD